MLKIVSDQIRPFSIRSNDGTIEHFLLGQGNESSRCTHFRLNAVVVFGRIPLVDRSVDMLVRTASAHCPASWWSSVDPIICPRSRLWEWVSEPYTLYFFQHLNLLNKVWSFKYLFIIWMKLPNLYLSRVRIYVVFIDSTFVWPYRDLLKNRLSES